MIYLLSLFSDIDGLGMLRVLDYISFRAAAAAVTAFLTVMLLGPYTVRQLKRFRATAACRYEGLMPEEMINREKDKTPSMGGVLIVGAIALSTVLWAKMTNPIAVVLLATLLSFSALGFVDDYAKVAKQKRDGISAKTKLLGQFLTVMIGLLFLYAMPEQYGVPLTSFYVPFMKEPWFSSNFVLLFDIVVVIGASNAVNLTDGKDGLSSGCVIFAVGAYAVIAYLSGHVVFAKYLFIPYIPSAGEALVFSAAIAGSCAGFLWYNCFPASMFMGDTGSLALGGALGMLAVIVRQELLLAIIGGVFVMEAGSVMLQVPYFKLTHGKRLFRCTPIHHHFEYKGWKETQIVIRFWILAGIFALIGLATLKLR
ncbi:MAG: phospho-N-acetylmuramoyl-pentapeptide-transferase [Victivallaceae bacterium]|nr:phospho-N-acetylmuramoyl-pentapeptide-transferase [Victivallaceae bacterium]